MHKPNFNALWKFGLVLGFAFVAVSPAPAFYWVTKPPPTLVIPPLPGSDPPPQPPVIVIPPDPGDPGTSENVPEPAAATAGLIGLFTLSARRLFRPRR